MKKTLLSAFAATAVIGGMAAPAMAEVHWLGRILLFPLAGLAEVQANNSPEKASCWNEGRSEVAGCAVADRYDESRPTVLPMPVE